MTPLRRYDVLPAICIDTREQDPLDFTPWASEGLLTARGTIRTGDYSLEGYEHRVTVERKRVAELYHTVGAGRERFEAELERMRTMESAHIVIEGDLRDLWAGGRLDLPGKIARAIGLCRTAGVRRETVIAELERVEVAPPGNVPPSAVVQSLVSWSGKYGVPVWLAGDARGAADITLGILRAWYRRAVAVPSAELGRSYL